MYKDPYTYISSTITDIYKKPEILCITPTKYVLNPIYDPIITTVKQRHPTIEVKNGKYYSFANLY